MIPLVILAGPTAAGKSGLSISLAKAIDAEIINADSMQVYKGMDIGSAKLSVPERGGILHHLIDIVEPVRDFSVFDFLGYAKAAVADVASRNKVPLVVGGTGFYIQALIKDVDFDSSPVDDRYRQMLAELAKSDPAALYGMLKEADPKAAEDIHPNNLKRIMRALEFIHAGNGAISEHNKRQRDKVSPYNYIYFVLSRDRAGLYERIDKRVELMMQEGFLDEVSSLKENGLKQGMTASYGLGYRELLSYLDGETGLAKAVDNIKLNTRHYAKRQLTWFRRESDAIWLDADSHSEPELVEIIKKNLIRAGIMK